MNTISESANTRNSFTLKSFNLYIVNCFTGFRVKLFALITYCVNIMVLFRVVYRRQ